MGNGGHHIRCGVKQMIRNITYEGRTLRIADEKSVLLPSGAGNHAAYWRFVPLALTNAPPFFPLSALECTATRIITFGIFKFMRGDNTRATNWNRNPPIQRFSKNSSNEIFA